MIIFTACALFFVLLFLAIGYITISDDFESLWDGEEYKD